MKSLLEQPQGQNKVSLLNIWGWEVHTHNQLDKTVRDKYLLVSLLFPEIKGINGSLSDTLYFVLTFVRVEEV